MRPVSLTDVEARDPYDRLFDLCRRQEWELDLVRGPARPDLAPDAHDLILEVRVTNSPPPFAVHAPAEDPIRHAAAICLAQIRER